MSVFKEPSKSKYPDCTAPKHWYEKSKDKPDTDGIVYEPPLMTYEAPPTDGAPQYVQPVVTYAAAATYAPDQSPHVQYSNEQINLRDDFYSKLSCENYLNWRVLPSLNRLARESPAMARALNLSQCIIFLSGIVASILGALNLASFIPIVMGFSTLVTSMMHFNGYQICLVATNDSIALLQARHTIWKSQSNFERRNEDNRQKLIVTTENAILAVAKAVASNSASATSAMKTDQDHGAADSATRVAQAKAKAKPKAQPKATATTTPATDTGAVP